MVERVKLQRALGTALSLGGFGGSADRRAGEVLDLLDAYLDLRIRTALSQPNDEGEGK